jgi:hypothetical protein
LRKVKNFTRKFTKGIVKIILFIAIFSFVLLAGTVIALQFSYVQTKVTAKVTDYLSEKLTFPIHIDKVNVNWFDVIVLEGVSIKDPHQGKMIYVGEVNVDFQITSLHKAKFNIDEVILRNGGVKLIRYASTGTLNMNDFIDAMGRLTTPDTTNKPSAPFTIDVVNLENMYFSMDDNEEPHDRSGGFDHYHFAFDSIYGKVTNMLIVSDTFQIDVANLRTIETKTKIRVHEVDTRYRITSKKMSFENLYAHIGKTEVRDYFSFSYDKISDLSDFNDKIIVDGDIKNSHVSFHDLSYFAPDLKPYYENARVAGKFKGKVTKFQVSDLYLGFGKGSFIKGKVSFDGLPELNETFIELKFRNSTIHAADLKQYLDETSYPVLKKFGKIVGNGEYVGFFNDFVAKGNFNTDLGKIVSDINLKINENEKIKTYYKGHLITESFNLGQLINQPGYVQLVDMNGDIKGSGFSLQDAELKLNAKISRIGLNNYDYRNITTDAQLSKSLFDGHIVVNDTNLRFTANGKVDLRENVNEFKIKAHIDKANLKPLRLSSVETLFKSDVDLNFTGIKPDDIEGEVRFINSYLLYSDNKEIFIDSLHAFSTKTDDRRTFGIKSDLIGMSAIGNFEFTTLAEDAERIYKEYIMTFDNHSAEMNSYYKKKNLNNIKKYNIDLYLNLKNINSLLSIYVPELYLSPGVVIQGNFSHGYTSILNLRSKIDTLFYQGNETYNSFVEVNTSKIADSANVLAIAHITSEQQKIKSLPETKNFMLEAIWAENKINFTTGVAETNSANNGQIKGTLSFLTDQKELVLTHSTLNLLNKVWNIPNDNKIIFSHEEITFQNFAISNNNQSISLDGTISNNSDHEAVLKIKNFKVETINPLLSETKISGTLNGNVIIKDLYKDLNLGGKITLDTFLLNNFLIGNISGTAGYDNKGKRLNVNVEVEREKKAIIDLSGYIKPGGKGVSEELNLLAKLDNANLEILSPIFTGVLSDISGKATGDLKITGTVKDPLLTGRGKVQDGRLKIDYLGTTYYFEDYIYLEQNMIGFKKLKLKDEDGNKAIIDGGIYHDSFRDYVVNIKGFVDHFKVLNTTEKDNDLFYGEAIVTGDLEILGAFENLQINANASSNKGTKIYIPLTSSESIEQQSYITFKKVNVDKSKTKKDTIDLSGIRLNFNLNITPEAYMEIIFDKKAGDIIRGNGYGDLRMTIDTRGDFAMFGNYTITKGAYNFTLMGLINKEFKIGPNSTISWTGDPYEGVLDIKAIYHEYASLKPLVDSMLAIQLPGKYPVDVLMGIQGNLMNPQINLGIDILRYPSNAGPAVTEFLSRVKSNEQELNRQVFSLLMLRSFYRTDGAFSGVASGTNSGLSELLSNQLSNWLSQVDENLTIDMNLNNLDKDAFNTFQLRLSYTALDGRLRISRDQGSFQNYQTTSQTSNVTNIAGEWTIEYLLSQDGRFRLKLYNKNNTNPLLASVVNTANTSAGFSVLHTQSFNNLRDLLTNKSKKQAQNSAEQNFLNELDKENKEKEAKEMEREKLEMKEKEEREEQERIDRENKNNPSPPTNRNNQDMLNPKREDN